ncbi:MAG: tRNA (adenosine(37)-N6)-dimethylallyltransferase MiaA [Betaproteobacteria bacterium]
MNATPPAVVLMGPTASGKSKLALTLAQQFGAEIVSVDSAQIYRGMDIGTAKPDRATRAHTVHHLIDILDPDAAYSAAQFVADANAAVLAIRARGRIPLLTGGTMLYFKALLEGLSDLPQAHPPTRQAIDARAAREGWAALHAELARVDPVTAKRLAPLDAQRIQRALEVFALTGSPLSSLHGIRQRPNLPGPLVSIALLPPERSSQHQRIADRFDAMLTAGLVDELRALRHRFALSPALPSMRCVGYRQAWEHLEGRSSAAQLREKGIVATRQLAKRQCTWLRALPALAFDPFAPGTATAITALVADALHRTGSGEAKTILPLRAQGQAL